jgi:hypothetical protein
MCWSPQTKDKFRWLALGSSLVFLVDHISLSYPFRPDPLIDREAPWWMMALMLLFLFSGVSTLILSIVSVPRWQALFAWGVILLVALNIYTGWPALN